MDNPSPSARIAALNDALRRTFKGGHIVISTGVRALEKSAIDRVLNAVRDFDDFKPSDDPYGERDFGALTVDGADYFWKITYYGTTMEQGSADPAGPAKTTRVLTIMRADEY